MTKRPTSFDIAELAGVSQPTVSRALRGSGTVNEQTRRRIEAIARQLNYTVDKNASGLRRQASNTLALLFFEDPTPDDSMINPFFLAMLGSITRTAARAGYDLLISFQQLSGNWHTDYQDSHKADGIILLGYGDYEDYRARLADLVAQGTHFVRWGSVGGQEPGLTIGSDNEGGGMAATRHLIAQGRRRIAFLGTASSHAPEFRARYDGYAAALGEAGISLDPALQRNAVTTEAAGREAALSLIAGGVAFDAIFAASDLIAIGAMRALAEHGRSVPMDVAVVGFDDIPAASLTAPPLTTVMQDLRGAGEALVDALLRQIRGESVEPHALPTRLMVRGTSISP
jgi:DNA-binding LacI/PurR family transcriptional regulator